MKLDSLGFQVFAGCRVTDDERARSLRNRCSDKLKLLKLDVTRDDEVDFAMFQLEKMLNGNREEIPDEMFSLVILFISDQNSGRW